MSTSNRPVLKAMIFDMGGTLEDVVHKPEYSQPCGEKIIAYLRRHGIDLPDTPGVLMEYLEQRNKEYRNWGIDNRREITPFELWSQWYLKDRPVDMDRLRVIADNVANIWERNFYRRVLRPEAPAMLQQLENMGVRLGIISNTACQTQVVEILHEYGIHHHFAGCIYLSSLSGFRKPHPELFRAACADLDALPEESIYVGDTISRDVRGSRAAGYMATIRIDSHLTTSSDHGRVQDPGEDAEYRIGDLMEIISIARKLVQGEMTA